MTSSAPHRTRGDLCPGVFRPWIAEDGGLVRLRLIGGRVTRTALERLLTVARDHGDGSVHLTARANLQVRGLPLEDGRLPDPVGAALRGTGLLRSEAHELVRNVMVSPLSGIHGGRAALGPVAAELDDLLCADGRLAGLPGRFLFVLDDGRGDLVRRPLDLGLVAVSASEVQLRAGAAWGPLVPLSDAAGVLVDLARAFLDQRGSGPTAPWHVAELGRSLITGQRDPRTAVQEGPLPFGPGPGYEHRAVPDGRLDDVADLPEDLVVTPWHGLVLGSA